MSSRGAGDSSPISTSGNVIRPGTYIVDHDHAELDALLEITARIRGGCAADQVNAVAVRP